jgi:hypothetical protein
LRRTCFALVALSTLLASMAARGADADVLRQFGMYGRKAVDCSKPHGRDNPHAIYDVSSQGRVTRTLRMTPDVDGTFAMRNLRLLGPDTLQYDETGRQSEFTITVARINGKYRPWRPVRADGTVLIADGKFVSTGYPTRAFEKCPEILSALAVRVWHATD